MLIAISDIYSYVQENLKLSDRKTRPLEEGERLYLAGYIGNCNFEGQRLMARCITSKVSAEPHKIDVIFGDYLDYRQWQCVCSCKAGAGGKCKHIVATLLYVYNAADLGPLSCTDVEQAWGKRKQKEIVEVVPVNEFCHVSCAAIPDIAIGDEFLLECLQAVPESEASLHINGRKEVTALVIRDEVLKAIFTNARTNNKFTAMIYNMDIHPLNNCCIQTYNKLYPCNPLEVEKETFTSKERWLAERQFRITGTRCYSLFTYSKNDWTIKAVKYFYPKSFYGNFATKYGQCQENMARDVYRAHCPHNENVEECGLVVCPENPWLAASPDGIVMQNLQPIRLIEIKCPLIGAKKTVLDCLPTLDYMEKVGDSFQLKRKGTYFAQVQFYLSLMNLPSCDFIIFSSFDNSIYLEQIKIDEDFCINLLKKLKIIFFENMLHTLCEPIS